jgi:hypothetical protein
MLVDALYLREKAHYCVVLSRKCPDLATAQALEALGVELMEKATSALAEADILLRYEIAGLEVAVDRSQCTACDNLRLFACTQRRTGPKARSAATAIPQPSAIAWVAAISACANESTFSKIIRTTSSVEPEPPDASSNSRSEITLCTSQVNRTASTQLVQNFIILTFNR